MRLLTETFKLLSTNVPINVRSLMSVSLINSTRLISPASNNIAALSKNYYFVAPSVWNKVVNDSKFKIKVSLSDTLIHTLKTAQKVIYWSFNQWEVLRNGPIITFLVTNQQLKLYFVLFYIHACWVILYLA